MEQFLGSQELIGVFLRYFSVVARYQDDKFCGDSTLMSRAQYDDAYFSPVADVDGTSAVRTAVFCIRGIYPRCLNIKNEQSSTTQVLYLDVNIQKVQTVAATMDSPAAFKFKTSVYNRRAEAEFQDLPMVLYPHSDAALALQCKYGIIVSQGHRYARRCMFRSDFEDSLSRLVAYLVVVKGYKLRLCIKKAKEICRSSSVSKFGPSAARWCTRNVLRKVVQKTKSREVSLVGV